MRNLGKELWALIEAPQGYAFIGDDVREMEDARVLEIAKSALEHHRDAVRALAAFVRKWC